LPFCSHTLSGLSPFCHVACCLHYFFSFLIKHYKV